MRNVSELTKPQRELIVDFKNKLFKPDDDITISCDQRESLYEAIRDGLEYPEIPEKYTKEFYDETMVFMKRLLNIFKWDVYVKGTLGKRNKYGDFATL